MSRKQECKDCGCAKSEHKKSLCFSCLEIYRDNYKEYMKNASESEPFISPWHSFKLDNLKYLEQIFESKHN